MTRCLATVSLSLKNPERSLTLLPLFFSHHHQLYNTSKSHSPFSDHSTGGDAATIANALTLSANSKSFVLGTQIHGRAVKLGFLDHTFRQNNLIKMYSRCGVLGDGLKVFDEMTERNLVSWTLIISGAVQNCEYDLALDVYLDMTRTGLIPNEFSLGSVVKVCTNKRAHMLGLCVHSFSLKVGMEKNPFVGSSILHMYAKFGFIEAAERVFGGMDSHEAGCWNAMVGGYAQCGLGLNAMRTVSLMHRSGICMDKFTFINALKGCLIVSDLDFGRQIHGLIVQSEMEPSTSVMNALMDMYFKNTEKGPAFKVFKSMQERDVVSWNTVFAGSSQDIDAREVASLFHSFMFTSLKPNHLTLSILFRLCGEVLELNLGLQFVALAFHFGLYGEAHVASSLINMFFRCGSMKMVHLVFDSVPFESINCWNEMISGYNLSCDTEALKIFSKLWNLGIEATECTFSCALEACLRTENPQINRQIHGIVVKSGFASHGYVCSSLIKGYFKFGLLADVSKFAHDLENFDMVSWSTLISAFANQGCISEAIKCLNCIKDDGEEPDEFILGSILNGCARIASHHQTKSVHSLVIKTRYEANVFVASSLIDAYAKLGDIESARMAFDQSYRSDDVVLFNTMITAYAHHGLISEAMELFEKMKLVDLKPSQATFVSIISACSHMGLVDRGRALFKSMTLDYGMEPSLGNYGCLVDLLSRNGLLRDAKQVIEAMPFKPWPAIWRSLLNGCRIHGDKEVGEWAARKLFELVPENDAAYVLLSKVYTEDGNWEGAAKVGKEMMEKGIRKNSEQKGSSSDDVLGVVHSGWLFSATKLVNPLFALLDAEVAHQLAVSAPSLGWVPKEKRPDPSILGFEVWERSFANGIGLAAGFDKNAAAVEGFLWLAFGFVEVGSVTAVPQEGNPKPRVFILCQEGAIINRCGFNSERIVVVAKRLGAQHGKKKLDETSSTSSPSNEEVKHRGKAGPGILGVNLGKNKTNEDAATD